LLCAAQEYFGATGFQCPANYNPADYFIDLLSQDTRLPKLEVPYYPACTQFLFFFFSFFSSVFSFIFFFFWGGLRCPLFTRMVRRGQQ
jgi:hypothetical protein